MFYWDYFAHWMLFEKRSPGIRCLALTSCWREKTEWYLDHIQSWFASVKTQEQKHQRNWFSGKILRCQQVSGSPGFDSQITHFFFSFFARLPGPSHLSNWVSIKTLRTAQCIRTTLIIISFGECTIRSGIRMRAWLEYRNINAPVTRTLLNRGNKFGNLLCACND